MVQAPPSTRSIPVSVRPSRSGPATPEPNIAEPVFMEGFSAQVGRHQPLKLVALIVGIGGGAGEIVQDSVNRSH